MSALSVIWHLHCYNLADDGFGNLVPVSGAAWSAAYYYAYSF